ncbi:MAG: UDP-N-acetylmuramate dehydrogenase [Chitinophagales bacterium]|nr:UDP-N-acetylmuramate dehydrogenase [Chitinophagales bacterium]
MNHALETNLKAYNTFGFEYHCKGIIRIFSVEMLQDVLSKNFKPFKILGGGSNVLLTENIDAYILKNEIKGISITQEDEDQILVRVGAGEIWHQFVMWSLSHHLSGLENLSLIPGTVGAAPMQNIGAYGVEQETAFHHLEAVHIETGSIHEFSKEVCQFGYRESIFKNTLKDQYFITHVTYQLYKKPQSLHYSYGAIEEVLNAHNISNPSSNDIAEAIIEIRKSKLPDPKTIGNAGSFFKNPVISKEQFLTLRNTYANLPHYPVSDTSVKIPAAWLIDQLGFKGITRNEVGVHKNQALVLVHYGSGQGQDVRMLAQEIQAKVKSTFNIEITPEVNIW